MLKKNIRPKLDLPEASTKVEQFQNEVLRPILKLQHDILVHIFSDFAKRQKQMVSTISDDKLYNFIRVALSKNMIFRNQLLGIVIGHFTVDEYKFYIIRSSEFNKRVIQMIAQRLFDSKEELKRISS